MKNLEKLERLNFQIESNKHQLEKLDVLLINVKSVDYSTERVQSSGSGDDRIIDTIEKIYKCKNKLINETKAYMETLEIVKNKINRITDVRLKLVLQLRYIENLTWMEIADRLDVSYQWIYELHKKALKEFELLDCN